MLEPAAVAVGQSADQTDRLPEVKAEGSTVFRETLDLFLKLVAADQELRSLLAKHRLTVQYSITDLPLNCYVGSIGGEVVIVICQLPKCEINSEITIESDSATFYRVLRFGKWEDMRVTVHMGLIRRIRLSRDLDQIKAAFSRIYASACDKLQPKECADLLKPVEVAVPLLTIGTNDSPYAIFRPLMDGEKPPSGTPSPTPGPTQSRPRHTSNW